MPVAALPPPGLPGPTSYKDQFSWPMGQWPMSFNSLSLVTSFRTQVPVPGSSFLIYFFSVIEITWTYFIFLFCFCFCPRYIYYIARPHPRGRCRRRTCGVNSGMKPRGSPLLSLKSSQVKVYSSRRQKNICRGSGPDWRAGADARVCSRSLEIIWREMSPPRGAGQCELLWAYKWCSGALSCSLRGAARVQGGVTPSR